jgi:hypothetical protein
VASIESLRVVTIGQCNIGFTISHANAPFSCFVTKLCNGADLETEVGLFQTVGPDVLFSQRINNASTSGEQGVSCNGVSSLLNDINADTATDRCPKAVAPPSKKSRPRYVQASNLTLRSLFRCQFLLCQCLSQISPSSTSVALGELPTYLPFFVFHVGWMYCRFGECKVQALSLVQLHAVTDLACNSFIQTSVCRNVDFEVSVVLAGSLGYRQL